MSFIKPRNSPLKWTPLWGPLARFLSWKFDRPYLPESSCYKTLQLLWRLWRCGQRGSVVQACPQDKRHIHSLAIEPAGGAVTPDRHRCPVCQRLVRALEIVKGHPRSDAGFGLAAVGIALEVDVLVLQAAPQTFDEHVVHPTPAAVHGDLDVCRHQRAGEGRAGELAALVGVEDFWFAEASQRFLQCRHAER